MTVYNKLSGTVGIKHVFHGSAGVMSPDHQQVAAVQHISTHDCRLYFNTTCVCSAADTDEDEVQEDEH